MATATATAVEWGNFGFRVLWLGLGLGLWAQSACFGSWYEYENWSDSVLDFPSITDAITVCCNPHERLLSPTSPLAVVPRSRRRCSNVGRPLVTAAGVNATGSSRLEVTTTRSCLLGVTVAVVAA
uniref:Uncharacterized protein n=1 Tax=Leersia perrieri TaxID=77586 RepID=A0A0D9XUT3_9ORYZ